MRSEKHSCIWFLNHQILFIIPLWSDSVGPSSPSNEGEKKKQLRDLSWIQLWHNSSASGHPPSLHLPSHPLKHKKLTCFPDCCLGPWWMALALCYSWLQHVTQEGKGYVRVWNSSKRGWTIMTKSRFHGMMRPELVSPSPPQIIHLLLLWLYWPEAQKKPTDWIHHLLSHQRGPLNVNNYNGHKYTLISDEEETAQHHIKEEQLTTLEQQDSITHIFNISCMINVVAFLRLMHLFIETQTCQSYCACEKQQTPRNETRGVVGFFPFKPL